VVSTDRVSPQDRIQLLRQRCIKALGYDQFQAAHAFLKAANDADDDVVDDDDALETGGEQFGGLHDSDEQTQARLVQILGPDKVHFSSLIDQLIFMEDSL